EVLIGLSMLRMPKPVILVELAETEKEELTSKEKAVEAMLRENHIKFRTLASEAERDKYWVMRRESFNLLRQKVKGKRTAPFVEDFCVAPRNIPEFLPELLAILKEAGIKANIAGHAGN